MDKATNHIPLSAVSINHKNPRVITDSEFKRLKRSLKMDPEIMTVNPLVLTSREDFTILAGEQRYKVLLELGYTEVPHTWILFADTLTEAQREKFILLDNDHAGGWDVAKLTQHWDTNKIKQDWEITIPGLDTDSLIPELLPISETPTSELEKRPSATDDRYSIFEVVMEHDQKLRLLEVINRVKVEEKLEKLSDALMLIVDSYN
jgi:hypothetical protein